MTCQEFLEYITDAVDRHLPPELHASFSDHDCKCPECHDEFVLEGITKSAVQAHLVKLPTPPTLLASVLSQLRREPSEENRQSRARWWSRLWSSVFLKPLIGFAVACAAVVLLLTRSQQFSPSSLFSPPDNNVIRQSLSNYHALVSGDIKLQLVSNEPELLRRFFDGKTEYPVLLPAMKECTLVGGVVNNYSGTMLAHVVYRHDSGIVYMYQACWSTVMKGEKLKLPESAQSALKRTGWFVEADPDGDTIVLWRKGNTLCAAVAHMPKENLIACLTSDVPAAREAW